MPRVIQSSSSSDSSSDDDLYVNAAFKLNALNSQIKCKPRPIPHFNDNVVTTNQPERSKSPTPPVSVVESTENNDTSVAKVSEPVLVEDNGKEDPVIRIGDDACVDDVEFVSFTQSPTKRTTRNSRKRNATAVPETVRNSTSWNDSIEEELNRGYDDSFSMSQEEDDNCVMIGSPEHKRSNTDDTEVTIKVLWKSDQLQRFELGKNETFQKIFKNLAKLEGISEDQVLITKKEKRINPFDTPASIDWSILDILDGGIVSADIAKRHKGNSAQDDAAESGCKLKIQTSDRKIINMTLEHNASFSTLLKACSEQLNVPESKIKFYFDGEMIEMDDTPESLDLDDEACIDCKISK